MESERTTSGQEPEMDGSPRWRRTLLVAAVAQAFSILGFAFVTPFLPLYIQTLGVHGIANVTLWAAMLSGFVAIGMAVASPIWGVLADRYGRKIMVVRAAGSAALLVALMALVTNVYQLLALRLLQGVFTGTVSASQALVSSQSPRSRLGFSMGVMQTAVFIGNSLGPLGGGIVAELLGFRPTFLVAGALLLTCAVLVGLFVHEEHPKATARSQPHTKALFGDMGRVISVPGLLPMVASVFAVQFAITQVYPILPQFVQVLQGAAGNAAIATGLILAGAGAAGALSSTAVGWFSDRIGHKTVLATAALLACLISIPQYFVTATWQLGVLRIADGFALGAMLPSASAILAGLVPAERRGAAYGISAAAVSLGIAAGPLTSAGIVAISGIRAVFLSAAVLLLLISGWVTLVVPAGSSRRMRPGILRWRPRP
ncbi:MAG TPA: MFS transporter [Chloroflexota bacterium]|nr:MFS transporter [Chloroflexota bacterium]